MADENWSSWSNPEQDNKNQELYGGKSLSVGIHEVKLESLIAKTSGDLRYLECNWVNEEGQSLRDSIFLFNRTGGFSYKYKSLAVSLVPNDGVLRFEFFTSHTGRVSDTPTVLKGLVGLVVQAEVRLEKRGYIIGGEEGAFVLIDSTTKEPYVLDGGAENSFPGHVHAREAAKANRLWPQRNEIDKFLAPKDDAVAEVNAKIIQELMDN